jgi:serine protease Do
MLPDDPTTQPSHDLSAHATASPTTCWSAPPGEDDRVPSRRATRRGDSRTRRLTLVALVSVLCLVSAIGGSAVGAAIATGSTSAADAKATAAAGSGRSGDRLLGLAAAPAVAAPGDVAAAAAAAAPSVVTIQVRSTGSGRRFPGGVANDTGSGFIVGSDGWIVTCDHVVVNADTITVTLADGRTFDATIAAEDAGLDLALLQVTASGLPASALGVSAALVVGQQAIAIGSPLGDFAGSVTVGVISGLERTISVATFGYGRGSTFAHLIQTDAAINPGNSGGPLLDAAGEVVGIISAESDTAQGIGFAVPIDLARSLLARSGV